MVDFYGVKTKTEISLCGLMFIVFVLLFSCDSSIEESIFGSGYYKIKINRSECIDPKNNTLTFASPKKICFEQSITANVEKYIRMDSNVFNIAIDSCFVKIETSINDICERIQEKKNIVITYNKKKRIFKFESDTNIYQRNFVKDLISYLQMTNKKLMGINGQAISSNGENYLSLNNKSKGHAIDLETSFDHGKNEITETIKKKYNNKIISSGHSRIVINKISDLTNEIDIDTGKLLVAVGYELEKNKNLIKKQIYKARLKDWPFNKIKKEILNGSKNINPGQLQALIEAQLHLYPKSRGTFEYIGKQYKLRPLVKKALENSLLF